MKLYFDIGNSRIKWLLEDNEDRLYGAFGYSGESIRSDLESALSQFTEREYSSVEVYAASVAEEAVLQQIEQFLQSEWQVSVRQAVVSRECLSLHNNYVDTEQLGVDRWLAVLSAWSQYQSSVLVVNCGTAMTIDAVKLDKEITNQKHRTGQYLGGLIIPGVRLMQDCLNDRTHAINTETNKYEKVFEFARSTRDCIYSGSISAMTGLIERSYENLQSGCDETVICCLTGGAAEHFNGQLKIDYNLEPQLVLSGLERWAESL